jgi:TolA-binding protein
MITVLVSLSVLVAMIVATQPVPTAGELQASFDEAQKFYASGAYDQAIESYQHIVKSRSKYLKMDSVRVAIGEIDAPLQEVAPYQIGNSYFKMAEEVLERAAKARVEEERDAYLAEGRDLLEQAAQFFIDAESRASIPALQALARSQAVNCWYKMEDYERTIEGARLLLQHYPESKQIEKAMYDIGWAFYDMEDYPNSIEAFEALVGRFPSGYRSNRALFQIGESYFKLEQYPEAVPSYQRLVQQQRIGQMSEREIMRMKRDKLAGLVDETALEIAAKALIRIGVCYEKMGEYEKAQEAFRLVATQFADERRLAEDAYLREADMYYNRGDFEGTIAVYHRAIEAASDPFAKARIQLLLANRYFETEHYEDAVREYNLYRTAYGERADQVGLPLDGVGLQIARAWLKEAEGHAGGEKLEDYRQAEIELRRTLTLFPFSNYGVELQFNLGLILQQQGDEHGTEEAQALFKEVAAGPTAGGYRQSALFQIARIHHERGDNQEAATVYRQVISELGDKPEADIARFELGVAERDNEAWQTAVEQFLKVQPGAILFSRSRLEAGQLLVMHNELERAIEVLEEGAADESVSESLALFQYLIGAVHSQEGDYQGALPYFDKAMASADEVFAERVAYGRGVAHYKLGRYEEAIGDLQRQWTDAALAASAPRLLAAAYTSVGQTDQALQAYRKLMVASENVLERAEYSLALAEVAYRQQRYAEAVVAARDLLQLDFKEDALPQGRPYFIREKAYWLGADASLRLGQHESVVEKAAAGHAAYPDAFYAADFLFLQGLAELQLEQYEKAATTLNRMVERYPAHINGGDARYYLGYAYFYQTFFARAIPVFNQVVEQFPDLDSAPDALFRVAECRFNLGHYEEAQLDYQKVIARYPTSELREEAFYNIAWCLMEITPMQEGGDKTGSVKEAFNNYLTQYPQGRYVETAHYTLAEISFNEGEVERAYALFKGILEQFPGSTAAGEAEAVLPELREALSYQKYNAVVEDFERAKEEGNAQLYREVIQQFEEVWTQYPETMGGVGAKVNIGVCYQRLKEWKQAVEAFDVIIGEAEKGHPQVTPNVLGFVERRRGTIARKHL